MFYTDKIAPLTMLAVIGMLGGCTAEQDSGQRSRVVQPRVAAAESEAAPSPATTGTESLLARIDYLNGQCRGLPGDDPKGAAACEQRDNLIEVARKSDWCWGPSDAAGYQKHWIRCSEDMGHASSTRWYAHDINHSSCIASPSPADKMRSLQETGEQYTVRDLVSNAVEVQVDLGGGSSQVWTFYRSAESCEQSLPASRPIDSRYE